MGNDTNMQANVNINAKDNASKQIGTVKSSFDKLKGALQALGLAYAAIKIKDFLKDSVEAYLVSEKANARLQASVKNLKELGYGYEKTDENIQLVVSSLQDYASELQKTTTFEDDNIVSAQAMLGTFQLTGEEIKTLTPALLDMAAATEKTSGSQADLNDLAMAMGKALENGAGALSRYGIVLTDAQQVAYETATGMEKTSLLAQILADNFGGAAMALASTTAGQLQMAANSWGEFKEQVGAIIAPLVLTIVTGMIEMLNKVQEIIGAIRLAWDNDWGGMKSTVESVFGFIRDFINNQLAPMMEDFKLVFSVALGAVQLLWTATWGGIKTVFTVIWEQIKGVMSVAWEFISGIIATLAALFRGDIMGALTALSNMFTAVWGAIKDTVLGVVGTIIDAISSLISAISNAISNLTNFLGITSAGVKQVATASSSVRTKQAVSAHKASGGFVSANTPYIVGENRPELFVPRTNGEIIPNLNKVGGNSIIINLNGTISSKDVAMEYADIITQQLKLHVKTA